MSDQDHPHSPQDPETPEQQIRRELTQETVTRVREGRGEVNFRRGCLVFVLAVLALAAVGSVAMLWVGLRTENYPTATYAFATLFGTGGLCVGAWRGYLGAMPPIYETIPTGEGP